MIVEGAKLTNDPGRDEWRTPPELAAWAVDRWRLDYDAACSSTNRVCDDGAALDEGRNGLVERWTGRRVWCNPPFSNVAAFASHAWTQTRVGRCPVVAFLALNRLETTWALQLVAAPSSAQLCRAFAPRARPLFGRAGRWHYYGWRLDWAGGRWWAEIRIFSPRVAYVGREGKGGLIGSVMWTLGQRL